MCFIRSTGNLKLLVSEGSMSLQYLALGTKVLVVGVWELQGWPLEEDITVCPMLDTAGSSPLCSGLTGEHREPICHCRHLWQNLCKTGQRKQKI